MHKIQTIATDDLIVWVAVSQSVLTHLPDDTPSM